jgi:aryl-alcohol dehydrogenase-like predicted oxidoreductase
VKYRKFGNTGLMVSEIGMGCWELSGVSRGGGLGYGQQNDDLSIRMVRSAIQLGVNFFDTADAYGLGHSEVVVGRALRYLRNNAIIATKVGNNFYIEPWQKSFEDTYIKNAIENSIQRLLTFISFTGRPWRLSRREMSSRLWRI